MALDSREKLFDVFDRKREAAVAGIFRPTTNNDDAIVNLTERDQESMTNKGLGKIAGVFTDPQAQVMWRALKKRGVKPVTVPAIMVDSGQPGRVQNGRKQWAVIPKIAPDLYALDLEIFLTGYAEGLFPARSSNSPRRKERDLGRTDRCRTCRETFRHTPDSLHCRSEDGCRWRFGGLFAASRMRSNRV